MKKINENLFLNYSIDEIKLLLEKEEINANQILKLFLLKIKKYHKYNFLTKSSQKLLESKNFKVSNNSNSKCSLGGIPFLAKDIINTIQYNTEMGSGIWKGFRAGNNARIIDSLLEDGAVLMGKSTTAEFAVHHETSGINPHDSNRIPGTSSTGSAIAVSLGIVPFALGTQTAGSLSRPASYNGVWALKPSFGLIPRTGVLKTCDTLDTVGFVSSKLENMKTILESLRVKGENYPFVFENIDQKKQAIIKNPNIAFIKTAVWDNLEDYTKIEINRYIDELKKKYSNIQEIKLDSEFNDIHKHHSIIYQKSLSYYFMREKKSGRKISAAMKNLIKKGEAISNSDYFNSLGKQKYLCEKIEKVLKNFDLIISPATCGIAPKKNELEKDDASLIWTFLHLPLVFAPLFKGPDNLPFGLHFLTKKWGDFDLINILDTLRKDGCV